MVVMPEAVDTRALLEEAAREHVEAVRELTAARAEFDRLKPGFDAAAARRAAARREVDRIEEAMGAVRREHAVRVALAEADVEYEGPSVVAQQTYGGAHLHYLEAVGPKGTGLFIFRPSKSHRYLGKQHVVLIECARRHGFEEPPAGNGGTNRQPSGLDEAGAWSWEERGRGPFGWDGPVKPLPPPEGGRWRWLKIREQEELTA